MARLYAEAAFNIDRIDLNWFDRNFFDADIFDDLNTPINGITYTDVYKVTGIAGTSTHTLLAGGPEILIDNELHVTGGTVTALQELDDNLDRVVWGISGVDFLALDVYNATLSTSRSDDVNLIRQALSGNDRITLSAFADVISGYDGDDTINGNAGADVLLGGRGNDTLSGGSQADSLTGNAGADELFGQNGNDLLLGISGNDVLFGGKGDDILRGGGGNDRLVGGPGSDKLFGNAGSDDLAGGADNDILIGGGGGDRLNGGTGNDRLKGKGGADTLEFGPGGGRDKIKGFQDGLDRIDLTGFGFANGAAAKSFGSSSAGNAVFDFGNGDQLVVEGVLLSQLGAGDFVL